MVVGGGGDSRGVPRGRLARAEAAVMVEVLAGVLLLVAVLCMPAACQSTNRKGQS